MNNNDSLYANENQQFVISYELLCLLRWIIEHDAEKLKKIIARAVASGLKDNMNKLDEIQSQQEEVEDIQHSIIEFFGLMEGLLAESINEHAVKTAMEKNLMPTIDHIDSTVCDDATVRFSIEKATNKLEQYPKENPQEVLYKELLKRWKPAKKNILN